MDITLKQCLEAVIFCLAGGAIATPLTLLNVRFAPALGLIDWPKARGLAEDQVPIIGHSIVLFSVATLIVLNQMYHLGPWVILTSIIIGLMGHFDDRKPLSAADKLFIQALCIGIVLFLDDSLRTSINARYGVFGSLCAGVFILAMVNAVNFIDGIDGLAGSVIALGAISLALMANGRPEFYPHFIYGSMLTGMTIPFLYLNIRLRRGFIGNIGSYFFSFLLVTLHLSLPIEAPGIFTRLAMTGLCFLVPIADSIMVVSSRLWMLRSPFQPDKGHMHHRLVQTSIPLRWILAAFGVIELGGVSMAVLLSQNAVMNKTAFGVYLALTHVATTVLLILLIDRASRRRIQSYFERLDSGDPIYFFKYRLKTEDGSPVSSHALKRVEARINAEIRVTDYCFIRNETIFVVLKTMPEPLRGITGRFEHIFTSEKLRGELTSDQGEFMKVPRNLEEYVKKKSA